MFKLNNLEVYQISSFSFTILKCQNTQSKWYKLIGCFYKIKILDILNIKIMIYLWHIWVM